MQVVSSKWTLPLKLLIPAFAGCFFIGVTILLFILPLDDIQDPFTPLTARLTMLSFLLSITGIYYLFFYRLKWVAMDQEHLFVSNFFKSYQYTYDSIASIEETKVLFWNRITVHFYQEGHWGKTIVFFGSYYWYYFLKKNPEILRQILPEEITNKNS